MNEYFVAFKKKSRFVDLVKSAQNCDLCSRLYRRSKVLSEANGSIDSKVLFVAEAPGRLGADRTGVPLHGDRTGDNFESLLGNIGWQRDQVFITNAILCNPRQENGKNGTPTAEEIANCSSYLELIITLIKPDVVVSLGITALKALDIISPHYINLRDDVARPVPWFSAQLFPLYHPGPRAIIHRSLAKQRSDFMRLAKFVHPEKGLIRPMKKSSRSSAPYVLEETPLQQVARAILELSGTITYFKLTKMLYLVDLLAVRRMGKMVASEIYIRQVDGPWPPRLDKALSAMQGYEVHRYFARRIPMVAPGPSPRSKVQLEDNILEIVADIYDKYGQFNNSRIKTAVYRTEPMRSIMKEENRGKDMRNKPVLYKDKTASSTEGK